MSTPIRHLPMSFNTTGPCRPEMHFMLPPAARLSSADLQRFIDQELYWVLHAPRQTGKTSFLMSWMKQLNASQQVVACYVSVEACQGIEEIELAMPAICSSIRNYSKDFGVPIPEKSPQGSDPAIQLTETIKQWSELCFPKPLVILFDEVDTLSGPVLVSFLRQLRGGFASRGVGRFPTSVALVGMRDLKDYLAASKDGTPVNPGSPFNIKEQSQTLRNFNFSEVQSLLLQHTEATGQIFEEAAVHEIFRLSGGQPWLVNSLAKECVLRLVTDGSPIVFGHIEQAKEALIKSRAVHIDSLAERLKEPRVKQVIQPILAGDIDPDLGRQNANVQYCMDLGLIAWDDELTIANPIYREVLIRTLNSGYQDGIAKPEFRWAKPDGDLDLDALFTEFQGFWRRNGDLWEARADYPEVFPHLLLMGFFQRVLNGGAKLTREAAIGRERIDMLIEWKGFSHIIEIKLVHAHDGRSATLKQGLKQTASYAHKVGLESTQTLVIFDRTEAGRKMPWDERLLHEQHGAVTVWWF
jgi:hypothetical protein